MILYHGSYIEIPNPDTKHSREKVDFGIGFYTTPMRLRYEKPNLQIAFRSEKAVSLYLHYEGSEQI